ncbi:28S ribosomal protein S18b, mitochondrial isoform X3 [Pipistrellus kuhlii]|uniref:28S ribosomal protein S18b, mitochondrial isoform X3 n=1 Tax=Pipistrellus kuhlii TaxID=59472 RepID=UPI00174EF1BF|nr:28S ribosomal protein S18b, mitochondrial isoform X3 [Pipistrellus kuhlii]
MAAPVVNKLLRRLPNLSSFRSAYGVQVPFQTLSTEAPLEEDSLPISPYENEPWKYLDSEEYQTRYGSRPVWADYRRNHKGGVPPQKTRKTCIRKDKVAGNPCPICRDHKLHVDFRNVKLLQQFVCAHTGIIFHAPYTGVCMKQHKKLTQAIQKARDHGDPWYPWYSWKQPPERELSRLRRLYHGHLLEESGPPPESMPEAALAAGADTSSEPL